MWCPVFRRSSPSPKQSPKPRLGLRSDARTTKALLFKLSRKAAAAAGVTPPMAVRGWVGPLEGMPVLSVCFTARCGVVGHEAKLASSWRALYDCAGPQPTAPAHPTHPTNHHPAASCQHNLPPTTAITTQTRRAGIAGRRERAVARAAASAQADCCRGLVFFFLQAPVDQAPSQPGPCQGSFGEHHLFDLWSPGGDEGPERAREK